MWNTSRRVSIIVLSSSVQRANVALPSFAQFTGVLVLSATKRVDIILLSRSTMRMNIIVLSRFP